MAMLQECYICLGTLSLGSSDHRHPISVSAVKVRGLCLLHIAYPAQSHSVVVDKYILVAGCGMRSRLEDLAIHSWSVHGFHCRNAALVVGDMLWMSCVPPSGGDYAREALLLSIVVEMLPLLRSNAEVLLKRYKEVLPLYRPAVLVDQRLMAAKWSAVACCKKELLIVPCSCSVVYV